MLSRDSSAFSDSLLNRRGRAWHAAVCAQFYHWLELPEGSLACIAIEKMAMIATFITHSDVVEGRRRCEFVAHYFCALSPVGMLQGPVELGCRRMGWSSQFQYPWNNLHTRSDFRLHLVRGVLRCDVHLTLATFQRKLNEEFDPGSSSCTLACVRVYQGVDILLGLRLIRPEVLECILLLIASQVRETLLLAVSDVLYMQVVVIKMR